ncbi:unnamed protein product [Diamesa hyperborea]
MKRQMLIFLFVVLEVTGEFSAERDVVFYVKTRGRVTIDDNIMKFKDEASLLKSGFDYKKPTVLEIHGFVEDHTHLNHLMLTESLVEAYDQNVISVDWSLGAKTLDYFRARYQTENVGIVIAQQLDFLHRKVGLNMSSVTIIGFSLGAQIAGYTGKNVKSGRIGKIVGLDPAGPLYYINNPRTRLNASDANFVIALHTSDFYGIRAPIAHMDFFFNTGDKQLGCFEGGMMDVCSHFRAIYFYIEEVRKPKSFWGKRCSNIGEALIGQCFGEPGSYIGQQSVNGIFHIKTNAISPFGNGYPG